MNGHQLFSLEAISKLKQNNSAINRQQTSGKPILKPMKLSASNAIQSLMKPKDNLIKFTFGTGVYFESVVSSAKFEEITTFKIKIQQKKVETIITTDEEAIDSSINEENSFKLENNDNSEANETHIFNDAAKLYYFVKDDDSKCRYAERCNGIIHLNHGADYDRIVMRNSIGSVCLNCRLFKKMNPTDVNSNTIRLLVTDLQNECQIALLRFKDQNQKKSFLKSINDLLSKL